MERGPFADSSSAGAPRARRPPRLLLVVALVIALLGLAAAVLRSAMLSGIAYVVVLVAATGLLVAHRWVDGQASKDPAYIPSRTVTRLAIGVAVLIVIACGVNGFLWATELAKR